MIESRGDWQTVLALLASITTAACAGPPVIDTTGNPFDDSRISGVVTEDVLDAAAKNRGKTGGAGTPVSGAIVVAQNSFARHVTRTREDGWFSLGVSAGHYSISAWTMRDGNIFGKHVSVAAAAGTQTVLGDPIRLSAARELSGVVSIDGALANMPVAILQAGTDFAVQTGSDGVAVDHNLLTGVDQVLAAAPGIRFGNPISIDATRTRADVTIAGIPDSAAGYEKISIRLEAENIAAKLLAWIPGTGFFSPLVPGQSIVLESPVGMQTVRIAQPGYPHVDFLVQVDSGSMAELSLSVADLPIQTRSITGVVVDGTNGGSIPNATITVNDVLQISTDAFGIWRANIAFGCHSFRIAAQDYQDSVVARCNDEDDTTFGQFLLHADLSCIQSIEICDGQDNDCDGITDEAPACELGPAGATQLSVAAQATTDRGIIRWLTVDESDDRVYAVVAPVCPCDAVTRGTIWILDRASLTEISSHPLTTPGFPLECAADFASDRLFVSVARRLMAEDSGGSKRLDVFDTVTRTFSTMTTTVDQNDNSGTMRLQIDSTENALFLLDRQGSNPWVTRFNYLTGTIGGPFQLPGVASDFAYSPLTNMLYIAQGPNLFDPPNRINVINATSMSVDSTIPTFSAPSVVDLSNDNRFAIISGTAANWANTIALVDLDPDSPNFHQQVATATTPKSTYNRFLFFDENRVVLAASNQTGASGIVTLSFDSETPGLTEGGSYSIGESFIRFFPLINPVFGVGYITDGSSIKLLRKNP